MHDLAFLSIRDNPLCAGFYPPLARPVVASAIGNDDAGIHDSVDAALRLCRGALPTLAALDADMTLVRCAALPRPAARCAAPPFPFLFVPPRRTRARAAGAWGIERSCWGGLHRYGRGVRVCLCLCVHRGRGRMLHLGIG
jgi:hypothetical protein